MKVFDASMRLLARCGTVAWTAAALLPAAALAAPAAHVAFTVGDVQVIAPNGQTRAATKGLEVSSGETVNTNGGRAQLRFTDGAYVSLQPQSAFRIDDYRFDGKTDGSERGFFSLLKGGLRTITGLVGRTNRKNYQVSTAVATIGIRGTEYTIAYTNSISGSVGEGEIEVCTTRCVPFTSGESFFVADPQADPQLTFKKTDLPPAQPGEGNPSEPDQPSYVANDSVNPDGTPQGLVISGTQQLDGIYAQGFGTGYFQPGTVVLDANGVVTDLNGIVPAGPVTQAGNDGIVAWGYFPTQGSIEGLEVAPGSQVVAFVTGFPVSNINDLHAGNLTATYTLIQVPGGNAMLDSLTGAAVGQLTSASMTINFGSYQASAQMAWTTSGGQYAAQLNGGFDGPLYLNGSCNVGSCDVSALGQVFGTNAVRSGIAYKFSSGNTNGVGSAALIQTSLQASAPSGQTR